MAYSWPGICVRGQLFERFAERNNYAPDRCFQQPQLAFDPLAMRSLVINTLLSLQPQTGVRDGFGGASETGGPADRRRHFQWPAVPKKVGESDDREIGIE